MRSMLKRLQTLEKHTKRCRRVIFRFHLNDGRVVDSAMNALPEPSEFADDSIFLDFCEADLYL
jgi:hypothetical protein